MNQPVQSYLKTEKIMRFPQGKCKALTFSYDDGKEGDLRLAQIFEKFGLKGTFNLNKIFCGKPFEEWEGDSNSPMQYFGKGKQEIALHGDQHLMLDKVPLSEAMLEMLKNRQYLEHICGDIVQGMAYAFGDYNQNVVDMLKMLGVNYSRTVHATHSFEMPQEWLTWHPTCHHNDDKLNELTEKFLEDTPLAQHFRRDSWLFYVWGHSYEFDRDNKWDLIENLAKKISGKSDVWYATNGEIYAYTQAYNRLVYSADGLTVYNPSAMDVWLEMRGKTYCIPAGQTVILD